MLRRVLFSFASAVALIGATLFTARAVASPPPPPSLPIAVSFISIPHGNLLGSPHVLQMKLWYNDRLFYNETAAAQQEFPYARTSFTVEKGGTLKLELTLLDAAGGIVTSSSMTRANLFDERPGFQGPQVFTPGNRSEHHWNNTLNGLVNGAYTISFAIVHTFYR